MKTVLFLLAAIATAAPATGATLVVRSGLLIGADDVEIGGTLWDVRFVDGTCIALFDGCDAADDFSFPSPSAAIGASRVLRDQVLIDGPAGNFDTTPSLTAGCGNTTCNVVVPYGASSGSASSSNVVNQTGLDTISFASIDRDLDTVASPSFVFAKFSAPAAEIPVPAGLPLGATALGALALLRRRTR